MRGSPDVPSPLTQQSTYESFHPHEIYNAAMIMVREAFAEEFQVTHISKEVEDETDEYFHRMYNRRPHPRNMSVNQVLELLERFEDSSNQRDIEVFACFMLNVFREYKFLRQYPKRELRITALLFGGIIEHGLHSSTVHMGVAFRFVLDALKQPMGTKLNYFGLVALDRFKWTLKDYPNYCQNIMTIPHFYDFPTSIAVYVEFGAIRREPPPLESGTPGPEA